MATGLKSRVIYKEHTTDGEWEGSYKLVVRAKSIPSPMGEKNMIDVSTLEDMMEVQEEGRRSASTMAVQGAYDKDAYQALDALEGTKLDFINLYGTDGLGSIGKFVFTGTVSVAPDEATDDHLTMTATIAIGTTPKEVTDAYKVEETLDTYGNLTGFTVTKL